jgi:probable HAF family extracellular repeat protein
MAARVRGFLSILLLVALSGPIHAQVPRYEIIELGTLGGTHQWAYGVNNAGQVVGKASNPDDTRWQPFFWQDGTMIALDGPWGEARDINDAGQLVGYTAPGGLARASLWQDGAMTDLGTPVGHHSFANGINNAGQVVGASGRAFLWENGTMTYLDTLGGSSSMAYGINNAGQVVGWSNVGGTWRASLWQDGSMTDLGALVGLNSFA